MKNLIIALRKEWEATDAISLLLFIASAALFLCLAGALIFAIVNIFT